MTAYSARASSLVQLLDDVLAGRDPKGPKVPAILAALGWPYEEKMRAERARLARQGTYPVVLDLDDALIGAARPDAPAPAEPGEHAPEVVVPARGVKPTPLDEAADEAYPAGDPAPEETGEAGPPAELAAFLAWACKHKLASIRNEAERILARVERVRQEVAKGEQERKRLEEIEQLEARLRELKRESLHVCPEPDCGVTSRTGAGIAAHRRHAHAGATS
jgi:hypothetical protein